MPIDNMTDTAAPSMAVSSESLAIMENRARMERLEVEVGFASRGQAHIATLYDRNDPVSRDTNRRLCCGEGETQTVALTKALDALEAGKHAFGRKDLIGKPIARRLTPSQVLQDRDEADAAKDAEIAELKKQLAAAKAESKPAAKK